MQEFNNQKKKDQQDGALKRREYNNKYKIQMDKIEDIKIN